MVEKRLFIALLPSEATRDALQQTQRDLAERTEKARLTARSNLHMTLAFLGTQTEDGEWAARDALKQTADQMAGQPLPQLQLGQIGSFDKRKGGAIIWRGTVQDRGTVQLRALRELLRLHLGANGLQITEDFTPHITLARGARTSLVHHAHQTREIEALCHALTDRAPTARFAADRLSLMWSHRVDDALVYTEIGSVTW